MTFGTLIAHASGGLCCLIANTKRTISLHVGSCLTAQK